VARSGRRPAGPSRSRSRCALAGRSRERADALPFRRPATTGTLVVTAADPPGLLAFHLTADNLDVRIELEAVTADRTLATITVQGPWLIAYRRTLARRALNRLHALCQTAATP
jgi:hypothetical protein